MTFAHPAALLLLAALPAIVLLHRRRAPRVVRVASVAPWTDGADAAPRAERRGTDPLLAALLVAAAALAAAAAGPRFETGRPAVRIVVDASPTMAARLASGTGTVRDDALARARAAAAAAVPGAEVEEREAVLGAAGEAAAARAEGFGGIVLVTDRHVRPPRVRPAAPGGPPSAAAAADDAPDVVAVGPSGPAGGNFALEDVVEEGDLAVATVASHSDLPGSVTISAGGRSATLGVPPRGRAAWRFPAPPRGGPGTEVRISAAGDSLASDDAATAPPTAGRRRARLAGDAPRTAAALRALGFDVAGPDDGAAADVDVVVGSTIVDATVPTVHVAARGSAPGSPIERTGGPPECDPAALVRRGASDFPVPGAGVRLVAAGRLRPASGGAGRAAAALLGDPSGALAAAAPPLVALALDPEADGSDWHRDGSFVAAIGAAVDAALGSPPGAGVRRPVRTPDESAVALCGAPAPPPERVRALCRPASSADAGAACAAVGALAAAVAAAIGARRGARR